MPPQLTARVAIPRTAARIVILNGHFAPELSTSRRAAAGVVAGSLAHAIANQAPEVRAPRPARLGARALCRAEHRVSRGRRVHRHSGQRASSTAPIHVIMINGGAGQTMAHPRTLIVAGANSQARVAQTFLGAAGECHFTNAVTEVSMGENATLDLYTDQRETDTAYHIAAHARAPAAATPRSGRER